MEYYRVVAEHADVVLYGLKNFSLEQILECGQCFRWNKIGEQFYEGIAFGKLCRVAQDGETVTFLKTNQEDFQRYWEPYFDLPRDYAQLKELFGSDAVMQKAMNFCPGMRVLRQDPWEALCSFILSQNNNIKRIRGLVDRLCALLGQTIPGGYAFPTPQAIAACSLRDLSPVRAGFRTKYILDAARKVSGGEIAVDELYAMPIEQARKQLRTILGVGPKVAECALLYGWGRMECFPVDVWISRALERYYPQGFPQEFSRWAGIAQQYLFHYMRCCESPEAEMEGVQGGKA